MLSVTELFSYCESIEKIKEVLNNNYDQYIIIQKDHNLIKLVDKISSISFKFDDNHYYVNSKLISEEIGQYIFGFFFQD